jgi:hypothetical protein
MLRETTPPPSALDHSHAVEKDRESALSDLRGLTARVIAVGH